MNQLAPVIGWIAKNGFWLVCGIITLAMPLTYFMASGYIGSETDEFKNKINGYFSKVSSIVSVNATEVPKDGPKVHPNQQTNAEMDKRITAGKKAAIDAWILRYNEQRKMFKWPEEVGDEEFLTKISGFKRAEALIGLEGKFDNDGSWRRIYVDMLDERMANLCKIVDTSWKQVTKKDDVVGAPTSGDESDTGEGMSRPSDGGAGAGVDGGTGPDGQGWQR